MARHVSAREARARFAELTDRVRYSGESVIVEKQGHPFVAVVSLEDFEVIERHRREERVAGITRLAAEAARASTAPEPTEEEIVAAVKRTPEELYRRLLSTYRERSSENWNGYDSDPVSQAAYDVAVRVVQSFVESQPADVPLPDVGAIADGELTLEWYVGPDDILTLSIAPDSQIHFASHIGGQRGPKGTVQFVDKLPSDILMVLHRLYGKQSA